MSNTETALRLFKIAMGITHDKRDVYFRALLEAAAGELAGRGVRLDLTETEDNILLSDYCEFIYRNRSDPKPLPLHLDLQIRNRKVKGRCDNEP